MNESKRQLRQAMRKLPYRCDSEALCGRILSHPWFFGAEAVMGYMGIPPEPEIRPLLEACLMQGKRLALPRCGEDGTMTARWVTDLSALEAGAFGILEPGEELPLAAPEELDLILTPGLAFSENGGRLGRGKGYYDRFLEGFHGRTVGICPEQRLLPALPMEDHDRFMDAVITERRAILCEMEGK